MNRLGRLGLQGVLGLTLALEKLGFPLESGLVSTPDQHNTEKQFSRNIQTPIQPTILRVHVLKKFLVPVASVTNWLD